MNSFVKIVKFITTVHIEAVKAVLIEVANGLHELEKSLEEKNNANNE